MVDQGPDPQAAELFRRHFRFDLAVSDFEFVSPGPIGEIFAKNGPDGRPVASFVVGSDKLIRGWGALKPLSVLTRLQRYLEKAHIKSADRSSIWSLTAEAQLF